MKATDEKVADEAIEEARVVAKQDSEAVAKMLALLVRDECQVGGHEGLEQRMRLGAVGGAGVARDENVPQFHKPWGKCVREKARGCSKKLVLTASAGDQSRQRGRGKSRRKKAERTVGVADRNVDRNFRDPTFITG